MGKFSFKDIKRVLKAVDDFVGTAEQVAEEFKGKSPSEIANLLKANIKAVKNPDMMKELKKAFFGRSPEEIQDILSQYKNLSAKDVSDIARAVSKDDGLPEYLADKLRQGTEAQKQKRAEELRRRLEEKRAEKQRNKDAEQQGATEPKSEKKPSGSQSKLGKGFSLASKLSKGFGGNKKKPTPKPKPDPKKQPPKKDNG